MNPLSRIAREKSRLHPCKIVKQSTFRITDIFGIYSLDAIECTNKPDKSLSTFDIDKLRLQPFVNSYSYFWHYGRSIY